MTERKHSSEGESSETPPTYHALTRSQRDHLLATAHLAYDDGPGGLPNGMDIQRKVDSLRGGERPSNTTTYNALEALVEWGWLERVDVNGKTDGYSVTPEGYAELNGAHEAFAKGAFGES